MISFTTWEKFQFLYIERKLGKKLSKLEKCAIILKFNWRNEKTYKPKKLSTKDHLQ